MKNYAAGILPKKSLPHHFLGGGGGESTVVGTNNWVGKNLIQDIKLQAIFIQPTVFLQIDDKLGFWRQD